MEPDGGSRRDAARDQGAPEPLYSKRAFVDAYGDPGLHVEKTSTTASFIMAAVLVDDDRVDQLRAEAEVIRARHFGAGPIKSKKCSDMARRVKVLADLANLDFKFVAVAIDKTKVPPKGGLLFPDSFVKFCHSQLFGRIYERNPNIFILCDQTGREEFMQEFREYVLKERARDLFYRPGFGFESAKNDVLIQIADFMAGSLSRIYDVKKLSGRAHEIHELLLPKALWVADWPPRFRAPPPALRVGSIWDRRIRQYALDRAHEYVRANGNDSDPDVVARVEVMNYLLFWFAAAGEDKYISSDQILEYLEELGIGMSKETLRLKVFGPLRDDRLLIASGVTGRKIPCCLKDVHDYMLLTQSIVVPMLGRAGSTRDILMGITDGAVDVMSLPGLDGLREALDGRMYGSERTQPEEGLVKQAS